MLLRRLRAMTGLKSDLANFGHPNITLRCMDILSDGWSDSVARTLCKTDFFFSGLNIDLNKCLEEINILTRGPNLVHLFYTRVECNQTNQLIQQPWTVFVASLPKIWLFLCNYSQGEAACCWQVRVEWVQFITYTLTFVYYWCYMCYV